MIYAHLLDLRDLVRQAYLREPCICFAQIFADQYVENVPDLPSCCSKIVR